MGETTTSAGATVTRASTGDEEAPADARAAGAARRRRRRAGRTAAALVLALAVVGTGCAGSGSSAEDGADEATETEQTVDDETLDDAFATLGSGEGSADDEEPPREGVTKEDLEDLKRSSKSAPGADAPELDVKDVCALITADEMTRIIGKPMVESNYGTSRSCQWSASREAGAYLSVSIGISEVFNDPGLALAHTRRLTEIDPAAVVGTHRSGKRMVRIRRAVEWVIIESSDKDKAEEHAIAIAKVVVPRLT